MMMMMRTLNAEDKGEKCRKKNVYEREKNTTESSMWKNI